MPVTREVLDAKGQSASKNVSSLGYLIFTGFAADGGQNRDESCFRLESQIPTAQFLRQGEGRFG